MMNSKKGQMLLEYAMLITIVVASLLTMFNYIKRGVQGRFKTGADAVAGHYQYEPGTTRITGR